MAVIYSKRNFECLEQCFDGERELYIKLATNLCNLSHFSMLVTSTSGNSYIAQFAEYIIDPATRKHVDKNVLNCGSIIMLFSEAAHIIVFYLNQIYAKHAQNIFSYFYVKVMSVCYSDHDHKFSLRDFDFHSIKCYETQNHTVKNYDRFMYITIRYAVKIV